MYFIKVHLLISDVTLPTLALLGKLEQTNVVVSGCTFVQYIIHRMLTHFIYYLLININFSLIDDSNHYINDFSVVNKKLGLSQNNINYFFLTMEI